jgi:hypothetical protein
LLANFLIAFISFYLLAPRSEKQSKQWLFNSFLLYLLASRSERVIEVMALFLFSPARKSYRSNSSLPLFSFTSWPRAASISFSLVALREKSAGFTLRLCLFGTTVVLMFNLACRKPE